jgi:hypothetical protein
MDELGYLPEQTGTRFRRDGRRLGDISLWG